jgi:putative ABC transport system permease protein
MQNPNVKLAWRQLLKNKGFTALNVLGLTLGLASFLLIVAYIKDELSYDRFNTKADRIFRINTDTYLDGQLSQFADAPPPVAPTLLRYYPEVAQAVRMLSPDWGLQLKKGEAQIKEDRVVHCDSSIFQVFTLPMIQGDPRTALREPHTVVITETTAQKYFGTNAAVGRILRVVDDSIPLTVTGVIYDLPREASFHYDFFVSIRGNDEEKDLSFYSIYPMSTFVLLRPGADPEAFKKKLAGLMRRFAPEYAGMEDENKGAYYQRLSAMPLTDIHLHSSRRDELGVNGNFQYVYIFSAIALFVLLIAAINFMNLSTARSANRAREVGVRKVLGSLRSALIGQFLTESLLITAVAASLAIGLFWMVIPWFNRLADKKLLFDAHTLAWVLPTTGGAVVVVGLLAGIYPAFFLSSFKPVQVLKGKLATGFKGAGLRSTLVVFQFSISLFLIVGTLVVYRQLSYIHNKDLGFDRDRVLIVKGMESLPDPTTLKQQVRRLPGVNDATLSGYLPTNNKRWHNYLRVKETQQGSWCQLWKVDEDYTPTMGLRLVAGRNFSRAYGTDSNAIVINEAAAKQWGIEKDPLNKTVNVPWYGINKAMPVIGVVKDFNFSTLKDKIEPLAFVNDLDGDATLLVVRAKTDNWAQLLARLKSSWASVSPHRAFEYSFMDNDFDGLYRAEQRMGQLSVLFSTLAILIACLGLFGLAAYAAEQRTSEIGIRKILGASVPNIVGLLSKDFGRLIAISILIATPLAWLGMHKWLQNFAYRTTIPPWLFVLAAGIVVLIAAATTIYQSIRAAIINPVETLRNE